MKEMSKERYLFEQSPVLSAIVRLALPTVISQIILVIYNMADTFFVGMTGSDAKLTAVTVCMPAFMFLSAISNLFGVGGASVISRALGSKNLKRARAASGFAFWGCVLVTLIYSVGAFALMDTFVDLLGGAAPEVHSGSCDYLWYTVVLGGLGTSLNALLGHLVRSEGRSMEAGIGIALGGVLNIALDPLFMFVILPKGMETAGAGIATGLSNLLACVYFLIIVRKNRSVSVLSLKPNAASLGDGIPKELLQTGLPACLMTLCENISYAVLDSLMSVWGAATQAGIGVAKKVNMLAHCIVRGMTQGVLPLIAYNYASGDHKRMKRIVLTSTTMSVVLASICMAISLVWARELIGIFIQHESPSLDYGIRFLRILCIGGPFSACAYAFISFFQAVGQSMKSFILAILRKGVLDIPMMFILSRIYPIFGIVWATPITDIVCCVVAICLFTAFMRSHNINTVNDNIKTSTLKAAH